MMFYCFSAGSVLTTEVSFCQHSLFIIWPSVFSVRYTEFHCPTHAHTHTHTRHTSNISRPGLYREKGFLHFLDHSVIVTGFHWVFSRLKLPSAFKWVEVLL